MNRVARPWPTRLWPWNRPRGQHFERLATAIRAFDIELRAVEQTIDERPQIQQYVATARELLEAAKQARSLSGGWPLLKAARRMEIMWLDDADLDHRATMLRAEVARKLRSWRRAAATQLLEPAKDADGAGPVDRAALVLATLLRDEDADNEYRRNSVLTGQLKTLIILLGGALLAILLLAEFVAPLPLGALDGFAAGSTFILASVMLFGALGGGLSAVIPLGGRGRGRMPEMLRQAPFTLVRPLVGAGAAVGVYALTRMGVVSFGGGGLEAVLPVAFVAGFSERLLMAAVGRVLGSEDSGAAGPRDRDLAWPGSDQPPRGEEEQGAAKGEK